MGEFNEDEGDMEDEIDGEHMTQIYHKKENVALMLEEDHQTRKEKISDIERVEPIRFTDAKNKPSAPQFKSTVTSIDQVELPGNYAPFVR